VATGATYETLKRRADELVSYRGTTEAVWQDIADCGLGRRDFTVDATPGRQRLQPIYDGTFRVSSGLLSGAMHSLLIPLGARWFELQFENPALNDIKPAVEWLDAAEKRMYAALGAPEANFHAQMAETFTDIVNFGTGSIFIDDVPSKGVQFSARPLQELYLAQDPTGRIDTIVRIFKLTARQAVSLWGDKVRSAKRTLEGKNTEDKAEYIHIILPNDDHVIGNLDNSGKKWASFFLSEADRAIVDEGGYNELPMPTPRWKVEPGEVYGRGPGGDGICDAKMLNEMVKVTLSAAQMAVFPPYIVDSQAVLPGDLSFIPKSVISVDSNMSSMKPAIQSLPFHGNLSITEAMIASTRKSVQEAFLHQLVEMIRDPRMTATQVLELSAQMMRHQGPILGRMQTELLEPIVERVYAIESRAGRLPEEPPEIAGQPLRINYVSPVARAQQTSDARAIIDFATHVSNLAQVEPEVLDIVDFDRGARELADALGVPSVMMRDARQVAVRREARARMAEEEKEQQDAIVETDQAAKLLKAVPNAGGGAA